jgi:hypothetical protein
MFAVKTQTTHPEPRKPFGRVAPLKNVEPMGFPARWDRLGLELLVRAN